MTFNKFWKRLNRFYFGYESREEKTYFLKLKIASLAEEGKTSTAKTLAAREGMSSDDFRIILVERAENYRVRNKFDTKTIPYLDAWTTYPNFEKERSREFQELLANYNLLLIQRDKNGVIEACVDVVNHFNNKFRILLSLLEGVLDSQNYTLLSEFEKASFKYKLGYNSTHIFMDGENAELRNSVCSEPMIIRTLDLQSILKTVVYFEKYILEQRFFEYSPFERKLYEQGFSIKYVVPKTLKNAWESYGDLGGKNRNELMLLFEKYNLRLLEYQFVGTKYFNVCFFSSDDSQKNDLLGFLISHFMFDDQDSIAGGYLKNIIDDPDEVPEDHNYFYTTDVHGEYEGANTRLRYESLWGGKSITTFKKPVDLLIPTNELVDLIQTCIDLKDLNYTKYERVW
jgi:hypothetical protein